MEVVSFPSWPPDPLRCSLDIDLIGGWVDPRVDMSLGASGTYLMSAVNRTELYYACMPFGSHSRYRRLGPAFVSFFSFSADQFVGSAPK